MKFATITAVLVGVLGIAACGGKAGSDLSRSAGLCRVEGADVVCDVAENSLEDCTVLVGSEKNSRPVDFEIDGATIRFDQNDITILNAGQVFAQCGDGEKSLIGRLPVDTDDTGDVITPEQETPSMEDHGDDGEIITPSGPGDSHESDPTRPVTVLDPGTITTIPSGNAPTEASIEMFTVEKIDVPNNFMTYKISYQFSGAKQAYLYGNIFNRTPLEKATPACGKSEDGRFLVTNSDGNNLIEGSPNFETYAHLAEGKRCNANNSDTGDDCVMTDDAYPQGISQDEHFSSQTNPRCRLDLVKSENLVTSGSLFTRSYARFGQVCIAVQDSGDQWSVQCRRLDAPKPDFTIEKLEISKEHPVVEIEISFSHAALSPKLSTNKGLCVVKAATFMEKTGAGKKSWQCPITKGNPDLTLKVAGIGEGSLNTVWKHYLVRLGKIDLTFEFHDDSATHGVEVDSSSCLGGAAACPGSVKLDWAVTRKYSIVEGGDLNKNIATEENPTTFWAKEVQFFAGDDHFKTTTIADSNQGHGTITVDHDFDATTWKAKAYYFTSPNPIVASLDWDFPTDFSWNISDGGIPGGMDDYSHQHCNNTPNLQIWMELPWKGHGIADITSDDCVIETDKSNLKELHQYGLQTGFLHAHKDLGPRNSAWKERLTCSFEIAFTDGTKTSRSFTMNDVECH